MALPVAVPVGKDTADEFISRMQDEMAKLKVGVSTDPDAHYGPVVSAEHRAKIENYIQMGIDEGAELLVDGRGHNMQGLEMAFSLAHHYLIR